jgi:hypothetical protein
MSIKEKLAEIIAFPFTSAVDIRFSSKVEATTLYQEDYPYTWRQREVEAGRVNVETGGTMAFELKNVETGEVKAIVVNDFRRRKITDERAFVQEVRSDGVGGLSKTPLAVINQKTPIKTLDGIGTFSWKPTEDKKW